MPATSHHRLRAPSADGAALIDPPPGDAARLIELNRAIGGKFDALPWFPSGYRVAARKSLLALANDSLAKNPEPNAAAGTPLILTGHQPELFHPGVWLKNFLASSLAQNLGGKAINLVIDNDTARSPSIRVPSKVGSSLQVVEVPFDAPADPIPWENRPIESEAVFRSFAANVQQAFAPITKQRAEFRQGIILDRFWPYAVEALAAQQQRSEDLDKDLGPSRESSPQKLTRLGAALAAARNRLETDLGLSIHDYPVRNFGFDNFFSQFAGLLIARHREFHSIYNAALAEYRLGNHIRSVSHPVPELAQDAEWLELPFWVWTARDRQRRRAFVRSSGNGYELTDRQGASLQLPSELAQHCQALIQAQVSVRPRALITTMYARLVLSDLFIHGIGGAKYDELTDLIIRRFFGIEPPAYITATATFRLPIERPQVTYDDVRSMQSRIRDARYRPESFLNDPLTGQDAMIGPRLQELAAEKRDYLAKHNLQRCQQDVFDRLDRINRAMHNVLHPVEERLRAEHAQLVEEWKRSQLLGSREFSFCLFPSEILPARLLDLCQLSP